MNREKSSLCLPAREPTTRFGGLQLDFRAKNRTAVRDDDDSGEIDEMMMMRAMRMMTRWQHSGNGKGNERRLMCWSSVISDTLHVFCRG
jgi:hypothetical protein